MKHIIANWKAHKTVTEAQQWMSVFLEKVRLDTHAQTILQSKARVIICPPYPLIPLVNNQLPPNSGIFVGSQDISAFDEGSNTGETTAKMLAQLVRFSIIGHSERRLQFHETEHMIERKVTLAKQYSIEPILCIRDEKDMIYANASFIAYEPHESIGTGHYKAIADIIAVKNRLRLSPNMNFIYGGSINEHVSHTYLEHDEIQGLLIGTASLDPLQFFQIVSQVP